MGSHIPSTEKQSIFITAASGNIGRFLIPSLLSRNDPNLHLILPTSSAPKLSTYANNANITILEGPLSDPQWVSTQLLTHNITTLFLNLWGTDELFTAFNILSVLPSIPTLKHVVYLSACGDLLGDPDSVIDWMAPHTKIKPPVEKALQRMSEQGIFTHTVIGPSLFFENDFKVKEPISRGRRWVEPFGTKGASRVCVVDVAAAVEVAILDQGARWNRRKIMVGSLKMYTGEACAALWSEALGFEIAPVPSNKESLDRLEEQIRGKLGAVWGRDLRLLYEGIIKTGFGMSEAEYKTQVAFLGREPQKYEDFVMRTALEWKESLVKGNGVD